MVLPLLEQAARSGVRIAVRTRIECEETALLENCGITIETQEGLQHSYAVIDRMVVWYGNIMYLAYSSSEANALRFENADIAGELLELEEYADLPEQLSIEE